MSRTLLTCLATCLLASACAQAPVTAPKGAAAKTTARTDCAGPAAASRIPQPGCAPGQSFNQTDIRSTGQPTAAGAMQMLDPAIH
jgi:hypothetical protein